MDFALVMIDLYRRLVYHGFYGVPRQLQEVCRSAVWIDSSNRYNVGNFDINSVRLYRGHILMMIKDIIDLMSSVIFEIDNLYD